MILLRFVHFHAFWLSTLLAPESILTFRALRVLSVAAAIAAAANPAVAAASGAEMEPSVRFRLSSSPVRAEGFGPTWTTVAYAAS